MLLSELFLSLSLSLSLYETYTAHVNQIRAQNAEF